jgi:hypothetical protein
MKKVLCLFVGFAITFCSQLKAQKYTAVEYWKMEHDSVYIDLKKRQNAGDTLNITIRNLMAEHKAKLDEYFEKMSDNEKSIYFKNRSIWENQPGTIDKSVGPRESEIFLGEKSTYTRYLVSSGTFGAIYGVAAVAILGIDGGGAAAIPLLTAGASTLIPLLSIKDQKVTYNSLKLSLHGKTIGFVHGVALDMLITGDNFADNEKLLLGLSTITSIGLGRLGYILGRDEPWSEGRVGLYSFYGIIMPFEGLALVSGFGVESPSIAGLSILAGGAGGYLLADHVARGYDYTQGDITAMKTFAVLNGAFGLFILSDISVNSDDGSTRTILIPAATTFGATIASNYWLRGARLTNQQGRNTALATTGGAVIGLGIAALFGSESMTPYYVIPYLTGLGSYAIILNKYKKSNELQNLKTEKDNKWKVNFMPENILLNQKFAKVVNTYPGKRVSFLPAFSATCNF